MFIHIKKMFKWTFFFILILVLLYLCALHNDFQKQHVHQNVIWYGELNVLISIYWQDWDTEFYITKALWLVTPKIVVLILSSKWKSPLNKNRKIFIFLKASLEKIYVLLTFHSYTGHKTELVGNNINEFKITKI